MSIRDTLVISYTCYGTDKNPVYEITIENGAGNVINRQFAKSHESARKFIESVQAFASAALVFGAE